MSDVLSVVFIGEVDHGKSSTVGQLLKQTGAIPASRVAAAEKASAAQGKAFEPAFLLDALEEERKQGITIDVSHIRFATAKRAYRLIDCPGHFEFLKNMVTGTSHADAAMLIIDAKLGINEQTLRHSDLVKLLGIKQLVVIVNKMDLVGYAKATHDQIVSEHGKYLTKIGLPPATYIPLSAITGANVTTKSSEMAWHKGSTLIEALDLLRPVAEPVDQPMRFNVQDVYKVGDKRIVAGRVETGSLKEGDEVTLLPSGRAVHVQSVERWNASVAKSAAEAGESVGLVLRENAFVERGHVLASSSKPPVCTSLIEATLFWMGREALTSAQVLKLKLLSQECEARLERAPTASKIERFQIADVVLRVSKPIVLDRFEDVPRTGRFVLFHDEQIVGCGSVTRAHEKTTAKGRNLGWEFSAVTREAREKRAGHRGGVIWLTGLSASGKSTLARVLESRLFEAGHNVFVLDGDNTRHGLSADLGFASEDRAEQARRVGEVAKLFAQAGFITITALISPSESDRKKTRALFGPNEFFEVFLDCPLNVCESRDSKGLYRKARAGEITDFTGISSPFDKPLKPDVVVDTNALDPNAAADVVLNELLRRFQR